MDFNKHLINRFLEGTASQKEAEKVLEWFQSTEGQKFLEKQFSEDLSRPEQFSMDSPQERETLNKLHAKIGKNNFYTPRRKKSRRYPSILAVAASIIFLVISLSYLQFFYGDTIDKETQDDVPKVYSTDIRTHQLITMTDGTLIRLNKNSSLEISDSYNIDSREVTLNGEAFFEVSKDSLRPFIVHANGADVRVFGTKFIVKNPLHSNHIIVAVSEGRVGMGRTKEVQNNLLEKNMVGIFDTETNSVTIENMDVANYTSWIHGRVVFEKTPFLQVVKQLNHIYGIDYEIRDPELKNMRLTADFYEGSLDNVINTIAHSLGIEADKKDNTVKWSYPG